MNFQEKDISKDIQLLIVGYLTDTLSKKELVFFHKWLYNNDFNKEHFYKIKAAWVLAEQNSEIERPNSKSDIEDKWQVIKNKINSANKGKTKKVLNTRHFLPLLRIASIGLFTLPIQFENTHPSFAIAVNSNRYTIYCFD